MNSPDALDTLQREFARHVTRLDTNGDETVSPSRDFPRAIIEQLRSDRGIEPEERLSIYQHG